MAQHIAAAIAEDLAAVGASFIDAIQIDVGGGYKKYVCFYRTNTRCFEIEDSYHDGLNCRVSPAGEFDLGGFAEWPTLWELAGMTDCLPTDEKGALDAEATLRYLDQFPKEYEGMIRFIGAKLRTALKNDERDPTP